MAKISFRQGIVRHQTDTAGNPVFLNKVGNYVDLVVSPDPTIISFVHDDSDYLYTEHVSVSQAWGPVATGLTTWLYWDLALDSGELSRGLTTLEPIESAARPPNPATGQMWYNSQKNTWFVWNGSRFVEVVRVFAAKVVGGTSFQSMSIDSPTYTGAQTGLTSKRRVGSLVYGKNKKPLRNTNTNKFFTTEDSFVTGVPTSGSHKINNTFITGKAQSPIAAYQCVQYDDFNSVSPANPAFEGKRIFGIIEEDATTNEVVNFITEGIITNESWDWIAAGANANDPVYIDAGGQLSLANTFASASPVGIVLGRRDIFFSPKIFITINVVGSNSGGITPAQAAAIQQNTTNTSINATAIAQLNTIDLPNLISDINGRVLKAGDSLTGKLTSPSTDAGDSGDTLVTKDYVDNNTNLAVGYQAAFTQSLWSVGSPRVFSIPQAIHGLPLNTLYHVTVRDASTGANVGVTTRIDSTTGLVTIETTGATFAGTIRIS
jgi:hypothetical protein